MKPILFLLMILILPVMWVVANAWLWRIGKWRALLAAVVFSGALDFRDGILHNVSVLKAKERHGGIVSEGDPGGGA